MKLPELATLYVLVGVGLAIAVLVRGHSAYEGAMLVALWPLYGPFLVIAEPAGRVSDGESNFLEAMRRVGGTPLGALLPDRPTARALARRVRLADARVEEIDALLARPEFSEDAARARLVELREGGSERALATTEHRLRNIARLRALRARFTREMEEVRELLAQLTTQAEVVRLSGELDDGTAQLVRELVHRVEGLDALLDD